MIVNPPFWVCVSHNARVGYYKRDSNPLVSPNEDSRTKLMLFLWKEPCATETQIHRGCFRWYNNNTEDAL